VQRLKHWLLAVAFIGGSADAAPPPPSASTGFDPLAFFAGRTHGDGCLKVLLSRCRKVTVEGSGKAGTDGSLIIDQDVTEGSKPTRHRQWTLKQISPGVFIGVLSDASGPVRAVSYPDRLEIAFGMKGGLRARQVLKLDPSGRVASNHLSIRKLGIVVATLDETISKLD